MLKNIVLENCNAPGTGSITTTGAPTGRLTFVGAFGTGFKAYYTLTDGTQTEWGWTTTGSTLSRNVIGNSAGGTTALNFTGACQIYNGLPAERAMWADDSSIWQAQNRKLAGLALGTLNTDASRVDQISWTSDGSADVDMTGLSSTSFVMDTSKYEKIRLEWTNLGAGSGSGLLFAQMSTDGGSTWDGSSNYPYGVNVTVFGGSYNFATGTSTYISPTNGQTGVQVHEGMIEFSPKNGRGRVDNLTGASTYSRIDGLIQYTVSSPNAIKLGINSGTFTKGKVRLSGWRVR